MPDWQFENILTPQELLDFSKEWYGMGTRILGGCCGLGPEHIEDTLGTEILRFFSPNIFQVHKLMNMVKLLLLLCLISGMSFSDQSLADQNDPRLATLFLKLGNAETPQESKPFEKQIWQVWMEHES